MKFKYAVMAFTIFMLCGFSSAWAGQEKNMSLSEEVKYIKNMDITHIDPSTVPDGEYTGEFPFRQKYLYRVKVTVKSGKIDNIQVLENGTENEYAEKGVGVVPRMLKKQSLEVDAVSGATVSSKALMKCVEKALKKAGDSDK